MMLKTEGDYNKSGFTLIELSIVLVIIGLIVGGVLMGRDMIAAAQVRSQIKQIEDLETQINTFRLKYNCLPGDCANATVMFSTTDEAGNTITNGDGDGVVLSQSNFYVAGQCLSAQIGGEVTQLFLHLNLAKVASYIATGANVSASVGRDFPAATIRDNTGIIVSCITSSTWSLTRTMYSEGNSIIIGIGNRNITGRAVYRAGKYNAGSNVTESGIAPLSAKMIDDKADDGSADGGRMGLLVDCNDDTNATSYTALAVDCLSTIFKNIK